VGVNVCFGEKNHQKYPENQGWPLVSLDFKGEIQLFSLENIMTP
jgi:hypothetical protein